jgi:transposase-like protein
MSNHQRSVSEVQRILEDYRSSGSTIAGYCSHNGLNAGTFHWWLSRERKNKQNKSTLTPFIRLDASQPPSSADTSKQEMTIEIELRNGVRTRIQASLSLSQLSDLLTVCGR